MAVTAEFEITIARSAPDVFAHLVDLARYPEWLVASGILRAELLAPAPAAGAPLRIEQRVAGRSATLEGAITAYEPASRFAFRAKHPEGITVDVDAFLTPDGSMSRLRWSVRVGLPLKYRFFEGMLRPQMQSAAAADLERFRTRLQSVAG